MVTVRDIREQRAALRNHSIQESLGFLRQVGYYYEQTIPSDMEMIFIFETEKLINDLYLKSLQEPAGSEITEQLLEAVDQVGSLAIAAKYESFGIGFVRTAKQLGRTLIRISRM